MGERGGASAGRMDLASSAVPHGVRRAVRRMRPVRIQPGTPVPVAGHAAGRLPCRSRCTRGTGGSAARSTAARPGAGSGKRGLPVRARGGDTAAVQADGHAAEGART